MYRQKSHRFMTRSLSALAAFLLATSAMPIKAAENRIDAIVSVRDGFSPEECADNVLGRFPGSELYFVYDTLMNGFSLNLTESQYLMLGSLGFIEGAAVSGYYSTCEVDIAEYAAASNSAVGIEAARKLGLDGSGTLVAVIDSGFNVAHKAFSGGTDAYKLNREKIDELLSSRKLFASGGGMTADDIYKNERIPFAYDYAQGDTDVSSSSDHGTHVAGIIGAGYTPASQNESIAPGCQLLLMKVFDENGKASDYTLIAALEDAVKLGADVINLSLGRYSGSAETQLINGVNSLLEKAERAGCIVVCAAGNESNAAARGALAYADDSIALPPAGYTDYGTISYPASADYTIAVGSTNSSAVWGNYFLHSGEPVYYADTNKAGKVLYTGFAEFFDGQTRSYVVVPGIGKEEDYAGLDVTGKLVLVSRGEITFVEKANIAAAHGAKGVILYNNEDDGLVNPELTGAKIPALMISKEDGERLAGADDKRVRFDRSYRVVARTEGVGEISSFSSLGCTPSLTLKPDICGVGGGVYSTLNSGYGGLSGTSMAAPQIAGVCALLCQKLADTLPLSERIGYIRTALMNTASVIRQADGIEYSPRAQGAGLANLDGALSQELTITYTPNGKPKAELGDLLGDRFWLGVTLKNLTDSPLEVKLSSVLTSDGYTVKTVGEAERSFSTLEATPDRLSVISADESSNLNRYADGYKPLALVLEPGEERGIELEFIIDGEYSDELARIFTNGRFAEGFVYCETDSRSYSLPYMGYIGDWNDAPILDAAPGDDAIFGGTYTVTSVDGIMLRAGVNHFFEEQKEAPIAFSPDKNGAADSLFLRTELLRNAVSGQLKVIDSTGATVYTTTLGTYSSKTAGVKEIQTLMLGWDGSDGYNHRYKLPDGDYTLKYTFKPDFSGDPQTLTLSVRLDTKKPTIDEVSYDPEEKLLTVCAADDFMLQYVKFTSGDSDEFKLIEAAESPELTVTFDLGEYDRDVFYIEAVDQAYNPVVGMFRLSELAS